MRLDRKSIGLAIGGALIASMCCIGPMILFLLGIVSATAALNFSSYGTVFIILAISFVCVGMFMRFRAKECMLLTKQKIVRTVAVVGATIGVYIFLIYFALPFVVQNVDIVPGGAPVEVQYNGTAALDPTLSAGAAAVADPGTNAPGSDPEEENTAPKNRHPTVIAIPRNTTPAVTAEPPKENANTLNKFRASLGKRGCASCTYLIEDTWSKVDGVVLADAKFDPYEGTVMYVPWQVDEKTILDAIRPRYAPVVIERTECTYDSNMDIYCCDDKCYYLKGLTRKIEG